MIMPFPSEVSTSARRRYIRVRGKGIRGLCRFVKYRAPRARCFLVLRASLVVAVSIAVDASIGSRRAVAVQLRTIGAAAAQCCNLGRRHAVYQVGIKSRTCAIYGQQFRKYLCRSIRSAARIGSDKRACDGSTAGSGAIYVRLYHRR